MTARVLLRRAAELDLVRIEGWYESQHPGLGGEFLQAIDELFGRIGEDPKAFPERYRGARRALLRRFPYIVWFRLEDDAVIILACFHGRRDPRVTRARVREGA